MNTTEFLNIASLIVPDRVAIVFEGARYTYAELKSRVNRLANALAGLGVGEGDRVAVLQVNTNEHVELCFAAAQLDAVYAPLNFRARADELSFMVDDAQPKVLVAGSRYVGMVDSFKGNLDSAPRLVSLEEPAEGWEFYDDMVATAPEEERFPQGDGADLTVLLFTSGTTSLPKGVMLSHDSFSSYILSNVSPVDPDDEERNILTVPLYHIAGMQTVMSSIYGGRTLIIQRQFDPKGWMELVETERANRAVMVPTMLKMLIDHDDFHDHDLSSLNIVTYGAAPMPFEVIKRAIQELPGVHFINAFGQTETAATITMLPPEDHILEGTEEEIERKLRRLTSVGKPLDDVDVRIVDDDANPVADGEVGEIVASGPRLMKGYWNQEEATSETFRGGWLYTGDLGYMDEDGYIYLAGRSKDFIKRGGEMISPEEVEQVLHSHQAIEEAAIIGVPDIDWGERVRAVVVLKDGQTAQDDEIIEYCRQRLASFKKPESVVFVSELPRNPMGKVLKRLLREEYDEPILG